MRKLTLLNNKSRKGLYYYIREKGNKSAYYKVTEEESKNDEYLKSLERYYKKRFIEKVTNIKRPKRINSLRRERNKRVSRNKSKVNLIKSEEYLRKVKKKGSIESRIKSGISNVSEYNILTARNRKIRNFNKDLVRNLAVNPDDVDTLSKEVNLRKIRQRFEHRIEFRDKTGKVIGETRIYNHTPREAIKKIQTVLSKDEVLEKDYLNNTKAQLMKKGFVNLDVTERGVISFVTMSSSLRKGR